MESKRRDFLKKACAAGGCFCGFSFLAGQKVEAENEADSGQIQQQLMQQWISVLMVSLDEATDDHVARQVMRSCARTHYDQLNMDEVLAPYQGKLADFIRFLEHSWNWKVRFDAEHGIVDADENKSVCVCPVIGHRHQVNLPVLCYCSEGFAALMFSKVVGHPVEATVLSSIHRGDASCRYQIKI